MGLRARDAKPPLGLIVACVVYLSLVPEARGADPSEREFTPSFDDWGTTGLLQMPNARFQPDGEWSTTGSFVEPYIRGTVTLQGLPWLSGSFRYTSIRNRKVSGGDTDLKDKSVDVKVRLLEETSDFPQVALMLRDLGGTTNFGSEFLVANRRYYNWDFTLGIAWGNAGSRGNIPNPFGVVDKRFKTRGGRTGRFGGLPSTAFFSGEAALFGGIEYITPIDGLRLKLEYDGNDYQSEPANNRLDTDLPINVGVEYELLPWFRLGAAFERGNQVMLRGSLHTNFHSNTGVPNIDSPPPRIEPRPAGAGAGASGQDIEEANAAQTVSIPLETRTSGPQRRADGARHHSDAVERLFARFQDLGLSPQDISFLPGEAVVRLRAGDVPDDGALAEAALRVARAELTGPLERVTFVALRNGAEVGRRRFTTAELERSLALTGEAIALAEPSGGAWPQAVGASSERRRAASVEGFVGELFTALEARGLRPGDIRIEGSTLVVGVDEGGSELSRGGLRQAAAGLDLSRPRGLGIDTVQLASASAGEAVTLGSADLAGASAPTVPQAEKREIAEAVFQGLAEQRFQGRRLAIDGKTATLMFAQGKYRNPAQAVGRAARVLARHLPAHVETFELVLVTDGIPISRTRLLRKDLETVASFAGSAEEIWQRASVEAAPPAGDVPGIDADGLYPDADWWLMPRLRPNIGGPDIFFAFQLWAEAGAELDVVPGLSLSGSVGANIYNNFDEFGTAVGGGTLPKVRSDIREYLQQGEQWINELNASYVTKLAPEWYARASAGIFELMYTGFGGEVLYRPDDKRWAVGLDVNQVWKRDFDGRFDLRSFDTTTGHLSWYHKLPIWNLHATVRAGRYLAGDWGGTLDIARTFDNGITVGIFATKTNVSAAEFGEGSFDKGFYISVPFELFFTTPTARQTSYTFRALTRDGGQSVVTPKPLYPLTENASPQDIANGWNGLLE